MAKKETTKKKKTTSRKTTSKKIIEQVAENIIENSNLEEEMELATDVVEDPIMEDGTVAEPLRAKQEDEDPPLEVENGDPAVLAPVEEKKKEEPTIEEAAMKATFKTINNHKSNRLLDKSFGYSWNGMEIDL
jgi:hypothetical protein